MARLLAEKERREATIATAMTVVNDVGGSNTPITPQLNINVAGNTPNSQKRAQTEIGGLDYIHVDSKELDAHPITLTRSNGQSLIEAMGGNWNPQELGNPQNEGISF